METTRHYPWSSLIDIFVYTNLPEYMAVSTTRINGTKVYYTDSCLYTNKGKLVTYGKVEFTSNSSEIRHVNECLVLLKKITKRYV